MKKLDDTGTMICDCDQIIDRMLVVDNNDECKTLVEFILHKNVS